jgi:hypothetical protein
VSKKTNVIFYSIWIISLLIQAHFTELLADEAYYWQYSQQLAWGYFDHPPMVALFIKIGYNLFQNELGVRLLFVLSSAITIWIWQKIIKPKNLTLFYTTVVSIAILHAIGFIASPDGPMLLFASMFLLAYKRFLTNTNLITSLLLAITIACLLLTKYHGIIIIGITVLSNLKLLKSFYFWMTAVVSCMLLLPHILWQINAGYPSIHYHLFERSQLPYNIGFTLEYLAVQLIVLGPIIGLILFYVFKKFAAQNSFEKTLKWCFWSGYLFFLLMSFKGKTEAYWTLFIVVPGLYFAYQHIESSAKLSRIVSKQFPWVIALILIARVFLIYNFLPLNKITDDVIKKFHYKKNIALVIAKTVGEHPVAFMNSYQKASLLSFYTGLPSFSLNNVKGRKNQYDLWQSEEQFRGRDVVIIPNYYINNYTPVITTLDTFYFTTISNFQSYSAIHITYLSPTKTSNKSDSLAINLFIDKPEKIDLNFDANREFPSVLYYHFFEGNTTIIEKPIAPMQNNMLGKTLSTKIQVPNKPGKYNLSFSIKTGWLPNTINSKSYPIKIKK